LLKNLEDLVKEALAGATKGGPSQSEITLLRNRIEFLENSLSGITKKLSDL
jgi:hypothetical protein